LFLQVADEIGGLLDFLLLLVSALLGLPTLFLQFLVSLAQFIQLSEELGLRAHSRVAKQFQQGVCHGFGSAVVEFWFIGAECCEGEVWGLVFGELTEV
jgi:hypothetical protein